jgi:hypothetical protein
MNIPDYVFPRRASAKETSERYWECDSCWKSGVLRLGGVVMDGDSGKIIKLMMTCPFDSVITIIHSFEKSHPQLLPIGSKHPADQAVQECLDLCRTGDYDGGKYRIMKHIAQLDPKIADHFGRHGASVFDAFGDLYDMVLQFLSHNWLLDITTNCSNRSCSRKDQCHRRGHFVVSPRDHERQV